MVINHTQNRWFVWVAVSLCLVFKFHLIGEIGVGAKPASDSDVLFDGSRASLDLKWTYWEGPRFASSLPIKWKITKDPEDAGNAMITYDPAAAGGVYGAADIVTKKTYRDFRLHVEFLIPEPGGNSGVYLQNRYEIQVLDGDKTKHGMAAVINESESPYHAYRGLGKWNAYDITFRAARFKNGQRVEKAMLTMYFNEKRCIRISPSTKCGEAPTPAWMVETMEVWVLPINPAD